MRAASLLSILSGLFLVTFAFAAPTILQWQAENLLGRIGASEYVELAVRINLERFGYGLIIAKVAALSLIIAATMMYRRIRLGYYLTLCILFVLLCDSFWQSVGAENWILLLIKGCWWSYVFYFVMHAQKQQGTNWWVGQGSNLF